MQQILEEFTVTLTYNVVVDTDTGEITSTLKSKKIDKTNFQVAKEKPSVKKSESNEPQLILEDNKYTFNSAAIELTHFVQGDKIDIQYQKKDNVIIPIIGLDSSFGTKNGCKLTKSNTVSCKGSKHDALAEYGTVFSIIAHPDKSGLYILTGDKVKEEEEKFDIEEDLPLDADISDLVDEDITEIDPSIFTF